MTRSASEKHTRRRRSGGFRGRSFIVFLLLFVIVFRLSGALLTGAADDDYTVRLSETFEEIPDTGGFVNFIGGTGINFISPDSMLMSESRAGSIDGRRSLRIYRGDLRWWNVDAEDRFFRAGFSVKISTGFNGELFFALSTQDPATDAETLGGTLLSIRNDREGDTFLYDADGNILFDLKKDTVYNISADVERGRDTCTLTVNGAKQDASFRFRSPVYFISGIRLFVTGPDYYTHDPAFASGSPMPSDEAAQATPSGSGLSVNTPDAASGTTYPPESTPQTDDSSGVIIVDDVFVSTRGRIYPQKYSMQEPGSLPAVKVENRSRNDLVTVFVNGKEIDMSKTYVTENTLYISAEQFLKGISVDYRYDRNERMLYVKNNKIDIGVHVPGDEITVNGTLVKLKYPVRTIDDVIMISPNFINEVFNAKVWWDKETLTLAVTVGEQKSDDMLRLIGGKLFMNGEPYYEISFNKYDLFEQLWAVYSEDPGYPSAEFREAAAEAALKQLSRSGFRSVRVFCGADVPELMYDAVVKGKYYETMDRMFDLCDKYDIKVVACLSLISDNFVAKRRVDGYGLVNKDENIMDLVAVSGSESRGILGEYIREFVERYRSRKTILMYEIGSDGNLHADVGNTSQTVCYSLGQLASFYSFCAHSIKLHDGVRPVSGGDSILRSAQWNLFSSTMAGRSSDDWTTDTENERLMALTLLNSGLDVVSAHTFGLGTESSEGYFLRNGEKIYYGFRFLSDEAAGLGKLLYNGETSVSPKDGDTESQPHDVKNYLDAIIDAGIQISHWWTFRSDRQGTDEGPLWRNDSGTVFEAVVAADKALNEKYRINGVESENTDLVWKGSETEVFDPSRIVSGAQAARETSVFEALKWTAIMSAVIVGVCGAVAAVFRIRIRSGRK